jgi:DNA-binding NtrC family response regulator
MNPAHILVVDDEPDIRELVGEILQDEGYRVTVAENGEAARAAFARGAPDLVLLDIWMPDVDGITLLKEWSAGSATACPVVIMSGHGTVETAVEATRLGAYDFVQKPISLAKLLSIVGQALASQPEQEKSRLRINAQSLNEPMGSSAVMQVLRGKAEQAAQHETPVLITGESGSGREALARFIHASGKQAGPFVVLSQSDLEVENIRSILLGSKDGDERGVFEQASGGVLFIPELQNLTPDALKIFNQVLESGHYVREGSHQKHSLNCRLIASGPSDLMHRSQADPILLELYYRLNVLPLQVPPLRERQDDIPELVRFYADWFPNQENLPYRSFSVSAQNRLRNHSWPGNLRELRNLIQRLLILGGEGEVTVTDVEEALRQNPEKTSSHPSGQPEKFNLPLREAREQFEREYLSFKLREAGGSVGKLADAVGMERTHLYRKLRSLGVDPKTATKSGTGK